MRPYINDSSRLELETQRLRIALAKHSLRLSDLDLRSDNRRKMTNKKAKLVHLKTMNKKKEFEYSVLKPKQLDPPENIQVNIIKSQSINQPVLMKRLSLPQLYPSLQPYYGKLGGHAIKTEQSPKTDRVVTYENIKTEGIEIIKKNSSPLHRIIESGPILAREITRKHNISIVDSVDNEDPSNMYRIADLDIQSDLSSEEDLLDNTKRIQPIHFRGESMPAEVDKIHKMNGRYSPIRVRFPSLMNQSKINDSIRYNSKILNNEALKIEDYIFLKGIQKPDPNRVLLNFMPASNQIKFKF